MIIGNKNFFFRSDLKFPEYPYSAAKGKKTHKLKKSIIITSFIVIIKKKSDITHFIRQMKSLSFSLKLLF